ncbi:CBS domain-containing protein [Robertkochia solimangrovi]|nr:CBS domain-containing protein [Robertkochia solimangrovi]
MTKDLIYLHVDDDLYKAETLFRRHKIRHIPVIKGKTLVGILSLTDLLRVGFADVVNEEDDQTDNMAYEMFSLKQVMTRVPQCITPETTIKVAADILAHREFHALPVVDGRTIVGMLTTTDIIRYFLERVY